eukprot:7061264-Prymnesium_polylepis.1
MWQGFEKVRRPPCTKPQKNPPPAPSPRPLPPTHANTTSASSWVGYRLALRPQGVAGLCPPGGGRGDGPT